jgi:HAD superfamily hydrolase (TIGR01509 family)
MKGVIFDLDGTMVDNMLVHHRAWQNKLRALGMDLTMEQVQQRIHGVNNEILLRLLGDQYTAEQRIQFASEKEEEYRKIYKPELKLINGLALLMDDLKSNSIPMAIGSAAPQENVDFVVDNLGIRSYFQTVMHAGSVTKGKPDPEIYHKVAAGLNLRPEECLIFEDSPVGAEAASRAGMPAIILTTSHKESEFVNYSNILRFIPDYLALNSAEVVIDIFNKRNPG